MAVSVGMDRSVSKHLILVLLWSYTHVLLAKSFNMSVDIHLLLNTVRMVPIAKHGSFLQVALTKVLSGASSCELQLTPSLAMRRRRAEHWSSYLRCFLTMSRKKDIWQLLRKEQTRVSVY